MKLIAFLLANKGVLASVFTRRPVSRKDLSAKPAGNKERVIIKETNHRIKLGVKRDNKKAVIEARANGDAPATNQGLKGKEWIAFPVLKSGWGNNILMPVHVTNNENAKSTTRFLENGDEITREAYVEATIPSLHNKSGLRDMYDINLDHIVHIKCNGKKYVLDGKDADGDLIIAEVAND